jgi:site-specific DNA-methyltransferase (adenine-specific)
MNIEINKIYLGDCLEVMKDIKDKSIDMILCDLPYGDRTNCKWDKMINLSLLWKQYLRIIKNKSIIALTATNPFASALINSDTNNIFRYDFVWDKIIPFGFVTSKIKPMRQHELILIFSHGNASSASKNNMNYYPQGLYSLVKNKIVGIRPLSLRKNINQIGRFYKTEFTNYPKSILKFKRDDNLVHPTQKPVALFEYLIKTYTKENEIVLDNCIGSGTTAIACINTNRQYIGIEKDDYYFKVCNDRINSHKRLIINKKKFEVYK